MKMSRMLNEIILHRRLILHLCSAQKDPAVPLYLEQTATITDSPIPYDATLGLLIACLGRVMLERLSRGCGGEDGDVRGCDVGSLCRGALYRGS